ncbi:MAG: AEC family transporter [Oscillospiraceae bacterium]|nr:AEC family transporter [Oscillospiraceae bacterium]
MGFLLLLIIIGFVLVRTKLVTADGAGVLSKLETYVLVPALVMGTFMQNFTVARIGVAGQYFLVGLIVIVITIPIAVVVGRLFSKNFDLRNIYIYGLAFSNFGFMGNAVVKALFPEIFMEYLIFVLPFWTFIYMWGVPYLLMSSEEDRGFLAGLKRLINPMFIAMIVGIIIGILNIPVPSFLENGILTLGDCMSPIAMLLTGMTIGRIDLGKTFRNVPIYVVSAIRLVIIPLLAIVILHFFPISYGLALCTVCALAMPLGLSTIIIPSAYGKDTSDAAGMALISHLLSCITIPVIFMIFEMMIQ